ncbi:MAG: hypothetical protein AAF799_40825 [Myxococcota bacterium]
MQVWILVLSAMFTPVIEPLGLSIDSSADDVDLVVTSQVEAAVEAPEVDETSIRYYGVERMFAKLEARDGEN